ncbi:MAG: hypothetical protein FD176_3160 [Rhodospirillaceae bacterium]|nr:MAG: hypothetical protein FD176_3160 [Rhodospirillaceae bacterium]TNC93416.1 MAG: hypothetical protein FD119_4058 [Stygiobacter sp.]
MAETHVLSALRHKRGEIAGRIVAAERQITELRASLVHLDATLKLFAGDGINPEAIPARLPRTKMALPVPSGRGDITKAVLNVLRQTEIGLSTAEVAEQVATGIGVTFDTPVRQQMFTEQIRNALYRQRDREMAVNIKDGLRVLWRLVDTTPYAV